MVPSAGLAPTEAEITELSRILNIICVTKPLEEVAPNPPELTNFAKALDVIVHDGATLLETMQEVLASAGSTANAADFLRKSGLFEQMAKVMVLAHQLRSDPLMRCKEKPAKRAYNHYDIDAVAFFLENIAKRCGKNISLTKDQTAPAVAFIVKALKHSGVIVSESSVSNGIKRRRKRPLPVHYPE